MAGNQGVTTENIDEVILRLLKIKSGTELDYQTYFKKILNRIAIDRGIIPGVKNIPAEEIELLREELKRVKKLIDKGRFKVKEKKVKVSGTPPPKTGPGKPSGGGGGGGNNPPPRSGAIVKAPKGKLSTEKFLNQPKVQEVYVKDITEKSAKVSRKKDDPLDRIIKRLDSIIRTLTDLNKENKKESERQRKDLERKKRKEKEESLESKVFDGIKSAIKKMMAPFQSIWDYITNFLWNVFLGKVVLKLLDWFSDPKNKDKIGSIIRFFKDWWPTMLGAYILFGTSFGKLARTVVGFALKGAIGFGKIIAKLLFAIKKGKGLRVAGAFAGGRKGLGGAAKGGGWRGAALNAGLAIGGTLLTGFAIDKGVESLTGGDKQNPDDLNPPETDSLDQANIDVPDQPKIPMLNAASGGLADLAKVLGKFGGLGGMLGPLGMLMGMGMGSIPEMFQGLIKGKKGTDKIPAMVTDGEFIMSKGAVAKYGVDTLESMNAAGGGTNIPKIVKGVPHAAGGGFIGDDARKKYDAKHGAGSYDAESARRKASLAQQDAAAEAKKNRKPTYIESDYVRQLKEQAAKSAGKSKSTLSVNGINIPGGSQLIKSIPTDIKASSMDANKIASSLATGTVSNAKKLGINVTRESGNEEANRKALAAKRPWWDRAGLFGGGSRVAKDEVKQSKTTSPGSTKPSGTGYTPYQSRFSGARDAAHERAKGITGGSSGFSTDRLSTNLGNIFNGPRMKARTDYAASKGKYYSSSDQKTYGNYNDALAAKKSRMTSLASQQRLNKLSSAGANRSSRGVRFDAEAKARNKDFAQRGGLLGQMGRGFTRMFGSGDQIKKLDQQDKSANIATKQAGASSIGRYYSSSDGKYYANYAAADKARISRQQTKKSGVKPPPPKPAPKVAGGGMNGGRGSGGRKNGSSSSGSVRPVAASRKNTGAQKRQYGINK